MFAPDTIDGKTKVFEEIFESSSSLSSETEALKVLDEIRKAHPEDNGWVEFAVSIRELPNGKWCAVRYHAMYK